MGSSCVACPTSKYKRWGYLWDVVKSLIHPPSARPQGLQSQERCEVHSKHDGNINPSHAHPTSTFTITCWIHPTLPAPPSLVQSDSHVFLACPFHPRVLTHNPVSKIMSTILFLKAKADPKVSSTMYGKKAPSSVCFRSAPQFPTVGLGTNSLLAEAA